MCFSSRVNQYMGFGLSGSDSATLMFGADATITWVDTMSQPNAVDYHLSDYSQVHTTYTLYTYTPYTLYVYTVRTRYTLYAHTSNLTVYLCSLDMHYVHHKFVYAVFFIANNPTCGYNH